MTVATPTRLDRDTCDMLSTLACLADKTRMGLLTLIASSPRNEMCVNELCEALGMAQTSVSPHLALMRISGLVEADRRGKFNFYRIKRQRLVALQRLIGGLVQGAKA